MSVMGWKEISCESPQAATFLSGPPTNSSNHNYLQSADYFLTLPQLNVKYTVIIRLATPFKFCTLHDTLICLPPPSSKDMA